MKKLFAILLAVALLASMATVASAANTTTLTTTVPAATYTLKIPADQTITYGDTSVNIGEIDVIDEVGFAEGKNIKITITYTDFVSEGVSTTIPMSLTFGVRSITLPSGSHLIGSGEADGTVGSLYTGAGAGSWLTVHVNSADWGKALAGEYTATITFTAEVVAG